MCSQNSWAPGPYLGQLGVESTLGRHPSRLGLNFQFFLSPFHLSQLLRHLFLTLLQLLGTILLLSGEFGLQNLDKRNFQDGHWQMGIMPMDL